MEPVRRMGKVNNIAGMRFGKLTVIQLAGVKIFGDNTRRVMWFCKCDCGNSATINGSAMRTGNTVSCGCHGRQIKRTHGEGSNKNSSPEYVSWRAMRKRCRYDHPCWKDYGGRGISVCERWDNSYSNFLSDIGRKPTPQHSLDRIDNNGNYEPSNCRWASKKEQIENRRVKRIENFSDEEIMREFDRRFIPKNLLEVC